MIRVFRCLLCLFVSSMPLALGQAPQAPAPVSPGDTGRLPIRKVALYKNGIGYFEHLGQVRDRQNVSISFTSGQLNDVLKSLTVLDLNGGRITGVSYGSRDSTDRQLGELPISLDKRSSLTDFLAALRGARIEVRSGAATAITGRLLSVERKTRINGGTTIEVDYVALLTDSGEVRTAEVSPSFNVRLLEKDLSQKVARFLDVVSQEREPDIREMTIAAEGEGSRRLFVSYISEVPVWKSTYRVVFESSPAKKPLLQGWAIVDNTVGQDWEDVELSLVAGAPQSFIQNLSQPVYTRRPVVEVAGAALATPQTFEATLRMGRARASGTVQDESGAVVAGATVKAFNAAGQLVGQTTSNATGRYELNNLPDGDIRLEFEMPGFVKTVRQNLLASTARPIQENAELRVGGVAETVTVEVHASSLQTNASARRGGFGSGIGTGRGSGVAAASAASAAGAAAGLGQSLYSAMAESRVTVNAQELGDLFEYRPKERLSIRKNQSALVPIVQTEVQAEKVSIWNESAREPRPMRGLWLTNSTGLTLDGGTFSVLEENAFAGEGIFEAIRPGEKRIVSYATDLALNVSSRSTTEQQRIERVRIARGVLVHQKEIRETRTYTFRNEDTKARAVIVEHPVRPSFTLRSAQQPDEQTDQWMRFRLPVGAKETRSLVVEEGIASPVTYTIRDLDGEILALFVREKTVTPAIEKALREVIARQQALSELESRNEALDEEKERIFSDQERVRENLKSLKGSAEEKALTQRYTQQLSAQEDRLQALEQEIAAASAAAEKARIELEAFITDLAFDEAI